MKFSTTQLRKNLFQIVERAASGELVEVVHKGKTVRMTPVKQASKLSRLVARDTLLCSPDDLVKARKELQEEMRAEMEKDWAEI